MKLPDTTQIKKFFKSKKYVESAYLVIILLFIYISLYFFAQTVELNVYDLMTKVYVQSTAKEKSIADDRIVLVVIDDKSLGKVGRWPWPRKKYIELFEYLKNIGHARVITFDSVITGPDTWNPESDDYFFSHLSEYPLMRTGISFIEKSNLDFNTKGNSIIDKFALTNVTDKRENKDLIGVYDITHEPSKRLVNNVTGMGSVLTAPDSDKTVRTIAHIFPFKGKYYPSLALASILAYYGDLNPEIIIYDNKTVIKFKKTPFNTKDKSSTKTFTENTIEIPTENFPKPFKKNEPNKTVFKSILDNLFTIFDTKGNLKQYSKTWIKWYTPIEKQTYSHQAISAYKLLDELHGTVTPGNELDPEIFRDKIVLIGSTATGALLSGIEDNKATPLSQYQPGVDIQATSIDNLLNNDFMHKLSSDANIKILIGIIIVVILMIFLIPNVFITIFILVILASLYFFVVMFYFYPHNIALDVVTPLISLCVTPMVIYTYRFFIEKRKRGELSQVLGRVVSSDVMMELLKNPDIAELGGKRAEVTILFSDIRGFTTLSEKLDPDEVSRDLNEYFDEMEPIIHKHQGTLDKFMGDGIMAIFGAPVQNDGHAVFAVKAALDMQEKLKELNKKRKKRGKIPLEMGIGINTGNCFVGNLGSKKRIQYTAIGDAVNIASRLEQMNKPFNTKIIISQFTYEKVRQFAEVRALKKESLRGRTEPIMIYELKGTRDLKDFNIPPQASPKTQKK